VLLYLLIYLVMTLGAFAAVLSLADADGRPLERLDDLAGLARVRPWLATAIAIFMLSLAGLPPLFGFMAKLAVFNAAVAADLWLLAILGVLASVVAAYYYLRIVKILFFDTPSAQFPAAPGRDMAVTGGLMAAAALFSSPLGFLLLGPLSVAAARAAGSLF
jgi:NADH-quinone oxidoreductase subunit N